MQRASDAAVALRALDQEAVDRIVKAMTIAGLENAIDLAELAMEETQFGVLEDKVIKNYIATEFLYDYLKDKKSVGIIEEDRERAIQYVAEPIGVVLALLPITNPTSTALFKSIVAAKTRNALIMRPSARAARCARSRCRDSCSRRAKPPGCRAHALQVIPDPSLDVSQYLFHHPGVDFIWTTGGPKAVAAANAAGKPCLSVGSGNAPVYVHRSADVSMAVVDILISKTFDSSVICPAEQTCVIDEPIYDAVIDEFRRMGARLLSHDETSALARKSFRDDGRIEFSVLGQSCSTLAALAGFDVDDADKVLLAPLPADLDELAAHPFIAEKLMPVLGVVRSPSVEHAIAACELVTEHDGLGHTSAIYATDDSVIDRFALAIRTGRILVNAPTAVGALGGIYNAMPPTFSLGCGTWGGSNTTDNVNYRNLLNIKAVSRRQAPPQWFRVPSDTYFNPGALENLRQLGARRPMIVTDGPTEARGVADQVRGYLLTDAVHVFSGVEPEPTESQIRAGVEELGRVDADVIIAVGGGSVMDAAKAMRLFHESPELSLHELSLPFLDARKRIASFPQIEHSIRLVAVPTTAGTGSEVSPAAVVSVGNKKVTLVDYSLVPDIAVVDPTLTLSMPQEITADTGIDALTHALEAAVSIFASPYTDAFCMQAVNLILDALPRAYHDGSDLKARSAMANAATIAGLAFSNAFVGLNHALAHAVGARFGIAHGRANAIFLPHVLRYNASLPTKFMPAPGYSAYVAPQKYAQIAWILGIGGSSESDRREQLFDRVQAAADRGRRARLPGRAGHCARGIRGLPARTCQDGLHRPEHAHQPEDPADQRDRRAASDRLHGLTVLPPASTTDPQYKDGSNGFGIQRQALHPRV